MLRATKKKLLVPWEKEFTIVCPKCGGRIKTKPISPEQKQSSNISELQKDFCHLLTPELVARIPVLSEDDWKSKQEQKTFAEKFLVVPLHDLEWTRTAEGGPPPIIVEYGIFALIPILTETELKVLFLLLCLDQPGLGVKQTSFTSLLQISRSHASATLKKLRRYGLIKCWKTLVKGRARGRQLAYTIDVKLRETLDKNTQEHSFLRKAITEMLKPVADQNCRYSWRKGIFEPT